jgi:hypothetical protein
VGSTLLPHPDKTKKKNVFGSTPKLLFQWEKSCLMKKYIKICFYCGKKGLNDKSISNMYFTANDLYIKNSGKNI